MEDTHAVRDLPLCLSTGPHLPANKTFTMDFCLCGAISNLKVFCFGAIPDIMRVDRLLECATKQAVMTVAQWHRNHIIRGLWLLAKKKVEDGFMLTWCNFKFDGDLFNLDTNRRM